MKIYKRINNMTLTVMEKFDRRETSFKRVSYKVARKLFDVTFFKLNGYSAYDYRKNYEYFEE
jgi:hypothetical protein|tara:strand:- start:926 stop:1111 length:186 start_codon:yes stop_codon:yes gene_type:complete